MVPPLTPRSHVIFVHTAQVTFIASPTDSSPPAPDASASHLEHKRIQEDDGGEAPFVSGNKRRKLANCSHSKNDFKIMVPRINKRAPCFLSEKQEESYLDGGFFMDPSKSVRPSRSRTSPLWFGEQLPNDQRAPPRATQRISLRPRWNVTNAYHDATTISPYPPEIYMPDFHDLSEQQQEEEEEPPAAILAVNLIPPSSEEYSEGEGEGEGEGEPFSYFH